MAQMQEGYLQMLLAKNVQKGYEVYRDQFVQSNEHESKPRKPMSEKDYLSMMYKRWDEEDLLNRVEKTDWQTEVQLGNRWRTWSDMCWAQVWVSKRTPLLAKVTKIYNSWAEQILQDGFLDREALEQLQSELRADGLLDKLHSENPENNLVLTMPESEVKVEDDEEEEEEEEEYTLAGTGDLEDVVGDIEEIYEEYGNEEQA
ncbi:hypothetical protein N431DRAFT_451229 [Stipitochalara longipes BDJ]|nr:hypothetical protein N431DRAFT_451229 [Stipitochalara longipes BDJ]